MFSDSFSENIGVLKWLDDGVNYGDKHNIEYVLESFGDKSIIIDYYNMVNWDEIKNYEDKEKELVIFNALTRFFKENDIKKVVMGGDNYNYNAPPYHPEPRERFYFTKVLSRMIDGKNVKVLAICGGMQGILHFNGIKLNSLKSILGDEDTKYQNAVYYLNLSDEEFIEKKSKYKSCECPLNEIFIDDSSSLGRLLLRAEKKYNIKYERDGNNFFIVHGSFANFHAPDNRLENIMKIYDGGFKVIGLSRDEIPYIIEDKNGNIMIQAHPELVANIIKCNDAFDKRDVIFNRLLFAHLINGDEKEFDHVYDGE